MVKLSIEVEAPASVTGGCARAREGEAATRLNTAKLLQLLLSVC